MTPRLRIGRIVGGALGAIVLVAVLGFLGVAGTVIWMFGVALPGHARETAEFERDMARTWSAELPACPDISPSHRR